jgi:hypothetical protein
MSDITTLEQQLNSFKPADRQQALREILQQGRLPDKQTENVNLHLHSFLSFNSEGWSPTRIAWESKKAGLYATGIIDFDVLDGQEEFYQAGELLGLRTTVNLETRSYLKEYADKELDSPGEPGVSYVMGVGFAKTFPADSPQAKTLAFFRQTARERNISLIGRINKQLSDIAIDYERDVLPLTPAGNATERHITVAYVNTSEKLFSDPDRVAEFWSPIMKKTPAETKDLMANRPAFEETVRMRLAKRGGLGYVQPSSDTFPPTESVFDWVRSCEAIPMEGWLDGLNDGEADGRAFLECSRSKGSAVLNLIPDRNWNLKDPEMKARKYYKLREIIAIAESLDMPLNIGTEMNKLGQPVFDNLECESLKPFKPIFLNGARIITGHALLLRFAGFSYVGKNAEAEFKTVPAKNKFFDSVGALSPVTKPLADRLRSMGEEKALCFIRDSAGKGNWLKQ